MAKPKKKDPMAKRQNENHLQWRSRIAAANTNERDRAEPLITPETRKQGNYVPEGNGAERNTGASPVSRWKANNMLSSAHLAAIAYSIGLWEHHKIKSVTGNMAERVDGGSGENHNEDNILEQAEAERDLKRMKGYIPPAYFTIFENCVRFDEPSGVAGSRLGFGDRSAQARAHQVVCFVADIIVMNENLRY